MILILLLIASTHFLRLLRAFPFISILYAMSNAALYEFYAISLESLSFLWAHMRPHHVLSMVLRMAYITGVWFL